MLAGGKVGGLALIPAGHAGALRSFWAAALCLPAFLALRLLSWVGTAGPSRGIRYALAAELCGYAIAWAGFALASRPLAEATGRLKDWPLFLAAWNWGNVVQYVILLVLTVPSLLGLPDTLAFGFGLAAFGYALWLEWFIAKEALRIPGGRALVFVLLDLLLGVFIGGFVGKLTGA